MFSKKFLKKNYVHNKADLNLHEKVSEIFRTFWASKGHYISLKDLKKYYSVGNHEKWVEREPVIEQSSYEPKITWIGQSTFLIQINNINILTDPVFSSLTFFCPRNFRPGILLKDLPKIDVILISHNHKDHMEKKSILYLKEKYNPKIFVGHNAINHKDKNVLNNLIEKDWWQEESFGDFKIHFLPAIHWSGTSLFSINRSIWGSWLIEFNNFKIYFAGDTAYSNHFSLISEKFNNIDIALMPIGPNEPREHQQYSHIGGQEAVQAFIDLKAKNFISMHWGTYCLGADKFEAPIEVLHKYWQENLQNLANKNIYTPKFGQTLKFDFQKANQ